MSPRRVLDAIIITSVGVLCAAFVLDEAHHYAPAAKLWSQFTGEYDSASFLGLTATPGRADGSRMFGDRFRGLGKHRHRSGPERIQHAGPDGGAQSQLPRL